MYINNFLYTNKMKDALQRKSEYMFFFFMHILYYMQACKLTYKSTDSLHNLLYKDLLQRRFARATINVTEDV